MASTASNAATAQVCKSDAIDLDAKPTLRKLEVGAIIIATGHDEFDPALRPEYGYGRFKDVLLSWSSLG